MRDLIDLDATPYRSARRAGLSLRVLALTTAFLLLGEALIFLPSIARFRLNYLESMVASADLASLAKAERAVPMSSALEAELLRHVGALSVARWQPDAGLMLGTAVASMRTYDLKRRDPLTLVGDALRTLYGAHPSPVLVTGMAPRNPDVKVEAAFDEAALVAELRAYATRVFFLSLLLSAIVALLLFASLRRLIVRPITQLTSRMMEFRRRPEADVHRFVSTRGDEIGTLMREFARLQHELRLALMQKTRLAALGAAVGRVSHDLRGLLAPAVLISDRLEDSADPLVRDAAPRLVASLEHAVGLCSDTLAFVGELPQPLRLAPVDLGRLVGEVLGEAVIAHPKLAVDNQLSPGDTVVADATQLRRVFTNLARNSVEALAGSPGIITVRSWPTAHGLWIAWRDTGPGIGQQALPELFSAFKGSAKREGAGLGLAICREVMRAHGGEIRLQATGPRGTEFRLDLPLHP